MPAPPFVRIEPTQTELRAAWQHLRRPTWPASFEEAMQDAVLGRLVRMRALHPPAPMAPVQHLVGVAANVNAEPTYPRPVLPRHLRAGFVDNKRAAAGDRDD